MRRLLLTIIVILVNLYMWGQDNLIDKTISNLKLKYSIPILSKKQMYQDFDSLYAIIKLCNPQLEIRKQVTGIDILFELTKLREGIDTINYTDNFIILLYRAMKLTQDEHCNLGINVWFFSHSAYKKVAKNFDEKSFALTFSYSDIIRNNITELCKVKYIGSKYYILEPITIYREKDSLIIPEGSELKLINNLPINEYLQKYRDIQYDIRWDFKMKCFYSESLAKDSFFKLTSFTYLHNNFPFKIDSIKSYKQKLFFDLLKFYQSKCVKYLSRDSLLYIRCPIMETSDIKYYRSQILKFRKLSLKKVVIDIRGNWGGNDGVWISLLQQIIAKPIENDIIYLSKTNNEIKRFIANKSASANKKNLMPEWDNSQIYNVAFVEKEKIKPKRSSLNYSGKIYILQDENIYSAASSLTAMCMYNENMISIGRSNDKLGGRGIEAMPFCLPNSRLIFVMDILIDNTNAQIASDVYHSEVEIPISLPIEYYINRINHQGNTSTDEYLYNFDSLFKKVLE